MEADRFIFAEKNILIYGSIVLIFFILLFWFSVIIQRRKRKKLGDSAIIAKIISGKSNFRLMSSFVFVILGFAFIVLGQSRPQFGAKLTESKLEGSDIMIALDVSNSMNAEDIKPNRIERAKMALLKLADKLNGDRIGIIIFAGDAFVQLPLTNDYGAARMFISNVSTNMIEKQGTAVSAALDLAMKSFQSESKAGKSILIISDGENHEEGALELASEAAKQGFVIHSIGMGQPQGAPIPVYNQFGQRDYWKDKDGNTVISKLNENMLMQLAKAGNGIYVRASTSSAGLNALYDEIQKMEKQKHESKQYAEYNEQFQYFFGIALLFLFLELFILQRKPKRFENFSLFKSDIISAVKSK
jgi:Ca-activated chloride channel family protein